MVKKLIQKVIHNKTKDVPDEILQVDLNQDGKMDKDEIMLYIDQHESSWKMLSDNIHLPKEECRRIARDTAFWMAKYTTSTGDDTTYTNNEHDDPDREPTVEEFAAFHTRIGHDSQYAMEFFYRTVFNAFDDDGNGYLEGHEIWKFVHIFYLDTIFAVPNLPPTHELKRDLLETYDTNGDGKFEFEELLPLFSKENDLLTLQQENNNDDDDQKDDSPNNQNNKDNDNPQRSRRRKETSSNTDPPDSPQSPLERHSHRHHDRERQRERSRKSPKSRKSRMPSYSERVMQQSVESSYSDRIMATMGDRATRGSDRRSSGIQRQRSVTAGNMREELGLSDSQNWGGDAGMAAFDSFSAFGNSSMSDLFGDDDKDTKESKKEVQRGVRRTTSMDKDRGGPVRRGVQRNKSMEKPRGSDAARASMSRSRSNRSFEGEAKASRRMSRVRSSRSFDENDHRDRRHRRRERSEAPSTDRSHRRERSEAPSDRRHRRDRPDHHSDRRHRRESSNVHSDRNHHHRSVSRTGDADYPEPRSPRKDKDRERRHHRRSESRTRDANYSEQRSARKEKKRIDRERSDNRSRSSDGNRSRRSEDNRSKSSTGKQSRSSNRSASFSDSFSSLGSEDMKKKTKKSSRSKNAFDNSFASMDPLDFDEEDFPIQSSPKRSTSKDAFNNSFSSMGSSEFDEEFFEEKKKSKKKKSRSKDGFHSSFSSVGSNSFDDSFASLEPDDYDEKKKPARIGKPTKDEQSRILALQAKIMELDNNLAGGF